MIMVPVHIILFIPRYIFLSLAQVHLIGFTMSFYCKFHLTRVLLFFTVQYDCVCSYCTYIRLYTLYGLTECKINEMKWRPVCSRFHIQDLLCVNLQFLRLNLS
jgi:hypothetical protein